MGSIFFFIYIGIPLTIYIDMIKLKDILMEQLQENFKGSIMQDDNGVKRSVEAVVKFAEKNKEKYFKKDFPISKLKHELKWWDQQNKDNPQQSNARMMRADTSYPLLVIKNDSYGLSVADGLNRLKKAIDIEKKKVINVYIVPEQDIPDDTIINKYICYECVTKK